MQKNTANKRWFNILSKCVVILTLAGCATTSSPTLFQLIDERSNSYPGSYNALNQTIEVTIKDQKFQGFYIVNRSTAFGTTNLIGRRYYPIDTMSTVTSNAAKAYLSAKNGEKITCDFLFEDHRAVGDCRSSFGNRYQFVAEGK